MIDQALLMTQATSAHQAGRLVEAARLYTQLLERNAHHPDALHQMGLACRQLGKTADAVELIERAIAVSEKERVAEAKVAEYRVNLATIFNSLGRTAEALRQLDQARPTDQLAPTVLWFLQRAHAQRAQGATEAALETLRHCLDANGRQDATVWHSLALTCHEAGRLSEAIEHYRTVLKLSPHHSAALLNLAQLQFDLELPVEQGFTEKLSLALQSAKDGLQQMRLFYALAKTYDRQADYERAWKFYLEANAAQSALLEQRQTTFDGPRLSAWVDELINFYRPEVWKSYSNLSHSSTKPFFIVGMPRSGTTLLDQMLSQHPSIGSVGESNALFRSLGPLAESSPEHLLGTGAESLKLAAADYLRWLGLTCPGKHRVCNKLPWNVFHVPLIRLLYPNAKVILCQRDRMGTLVSCFTQAFTDPRVASICCRYDHLQRLWHEQTRLVEYYKTLLDEKFFMIWNYEAFVECPEAALKNACAFLELPWNPDLITQNGLRRVVRTASVSQVREPIHRRSVGKWSRFQPWLHGWQEMLADPNDWVADANRDPRLAPGCLSN